MAVQLEDLDQFVLAGAGFGEHPAGFGPAAFGGIDQDGLADAGELGQELADSDVQPGALGLQAQQVRDLQGQDASEGVHADVVLGPVEHR